MDDLVLYNFWRFVKYGSCNLQPLDSIYMVEYYTNIMYNFSKQILKEKLWILIKIIKFNIFLLNLIKIIQKYINIHNLNSSFQDEEFWFCRNANLNNNL